jgi:hypothetical protein
MRPINRRLCITWTVVCIIAVVCGALYWQISQPEYGRLADFKTGYYAGGEAVWYKGSAALWPLTEQGWLVNLPIIAWVFAPLTLLGPWGANLIFILLGLAAVGATFLIIADSCPPSIRPLVFLLFAVNGPLWYSLLIGNTTHFILLLLVSALVLWKKRWLLSAGILIGVAAVIKPMILLFGVYFAWRRNWRVVFGGAAIVGVALLSTIAVFGLEFFLGWYQHVVVAFAGRPMGAHNVQSLDGFLLRLETGPELLFNFKPQTMPFVLGVFRNGLVGSLLALISWAMWRNRRPAEKIITPAPQGIDHLELCLILVFCVTMSTVSWTHYYLLLMLPWGLYFAGRLPLCNDRLTHGLVWGSIVLCSLPFSYPRLEAGWLASVSSRTVQSIWLFGGLLLLWALLRSALVGPTKNLSPWLPGIFRESDAPRSLPV